MSFLIDQYNIFLYVVAVSSVTHDHPSMESERLFTS